jgi:hypothetical protein
MVILEYGPPRDELVALSLWLKKMPAPLHSLGEIVIIPGKKGQPIFAVITLICSMGDAFPDEWVYGSTCESNPLGVTYTRESLVVKRGGNEAS